MDKLVSTEWLAARMSSDDIVILDATQHLPDAGRDARAEFEDGHIPGARFLDLASFVDEESDVPKAVPSAEQFAERMGDLGIAPGSRIILYDDSAIRSSARAWFILDSYGEDNLAVLDGGLAKWRAEGRELSQRHVENAPRHRAEPEPTREVRTKEEIRENLEAAQWQVVDARDTARFEGKEGSGSEGHIPGARNVPFVRLLNDDGTYKDPNAIRTEFERAGVDLERPVVTTCNSGMTAAVLLFGLELTGKEDVELYDGSWMEWGSDPELPKDSGE
ncbi:MAG: 3-mercaptopyruvate sulfurtransferase [Altererythrobacter sp.]|nr:3-mercaptopyruvate sulfurtransferase [Altererythrobacter sp.]MBK63796.1 3-mercaptopyruvate sulfurtransferase [Altererythrobacter sp.]|tara:strand:- start:67 stop:894 length:828 start_codon:yes stop_codon:yes gene_type:complete